MAYLTLDGTSVRSLIILFKNGVAAFPEDCVTMSQRSFSSYVLEQMSKEYMHLGEAKFLI